MRIVVAATKRASLFLYDKRAPVLDSREDRRDVRARGGKACCLHSEPRHPALRLSNHGNKNQVMNSHVGRNIREAPVPEGRPRDGASFGIPVLPTLLSNGRISQTPKTPTYQLEVPNIPSASRRPDAASCILNHQIRHRWSFFPVGRGIPRCPPAGPAGERTPSSQLHTHTHTHVRACT